MQSLQSQPDSQMVNPITESTAQGAASVSQVNHISESTAQGAASVSQVASQPLRVTQPQPATPQAVSQLPASSASASQVAPAASQIKPRNVTKIAFGQITDLASEFHELRKDDQAHVQRLGVDIHLREHLEQELIQAEERLEHDNTELAQETTGIAATETSNDMKLPQNGTGDSPTALVQAKSSKFQAETDQIAQATSRDVKMLNADITNLHLRDVNEVKALRGNAETRSELSAQIAKEREELIADSGGLANKLGQIRDLIVPSKASPADSNADSNAGAASSEALVGQAAPVSAEQEAAPAADAAPAAEVAPAAAATAPEATQAGTWLR